MNNKLSVSIAQVNCELGNIDQNIQKHLDYLDQAKHKKIELIVFPELSLTGYQLSTEAPNVAISASNIIFEEISKTAPDMLIIVGFAEKGKPGEVYNSVAILRGGKVQQIYRKINIPTYGKLEEGKIFHKGNNLTLGKINEKWNFSPLICADMWNPALVHCAALQRPELIVAPINSAAGVVSKNFSNERNWLTNIKFYSMMYSTPILMANRYGPEKESFFWGGSCIMNPKGEILAKAEDKEELISAELDLEMIHKARFELPTVRDSDTQLIQNLLKKIQ